MTSANVQSRPRPFALIILDGWGYREETTGNAIAQAHKPCWDRLWNDYPHMLLSGSGRCVGLPEGQMGNSEVGHLNMGAGRVIHQDLTRIDLAIEDGEFFSNPVLSDAIDHAVKNNKAIHVLGLLSPGGVHSHELQMQALIALAARRNAKKVFIHAFLDGRDTPPKSAESSLAAMTAFCEKTGCGQTASIIGRYFAMDRDKRWERIEKAWRLLMTGQADFVAASAVEGLAAAYERGETDEFVSATSIVPVAIQENDTVIFMNFRADRARELTRAIADPEFNGFARSVTPCVNFVTLTEYDATLPHPVAFPSARPTRILGEYLSELGLRQLRLAETEKYAHVTFFLNGGNETPFAGEDRILVPSPKVATYDLKPEMSAVEVTDEFVKAIESNKYDVIICNFANPDMVGHTGDLLATIRAIETIDACLARITAALEKTGGEAIITADHGNAEILENAATGQAHTAHTSEPVPLIYFGKRKVVPVVTDGTLSDIAPTMLYFMGLTPPPEMTGRKLMLKM